MEVLDFSDKVIRINTGGYLVSRLYVAAVVVGETVYELLFESLKELFARLQRGDVFT